MFQLSEQQAKVNSFNPRAEIHGPDTELAGDIKFTITVSNDVLDLFDEDLKSFLYRKPTEDEIDLVDKAEGTQRFTALRKPLLGKLGWGYEGAGYKLTIHQGFTGDQDLILMDTTIDGFRFDCKEGGSIDIDFRIISHPDEEEAGQLCGLIQGKVNISLDPPSVDQMSLGDAIGEMPGLSVVE